MRKTNIFLLSIIIIFICAACSRKGNNNINIEKPQIILKTTPVKDQGNSSLCWAYAMLATMETDHLMRGDSVNLSIAWPVRAYIKDLATQYYFSRGTKDISLRGMGSTMIHLLNAYGLQNYDSYEDTHDGNYRVLVRKLMRVADAEASRGGNLNSLNKGFDDTLDAMMGYEPANTVHMLGAEYTPQEFAHSVCAMDEYLSLTSVTSEPFYESFVMNLPDNIYKDEYLNIPLDSMMQHIDRALANGHPVCWEGDVSEPQFSSPEAGVYVSLGQMDSKRFTPANRQRQIENLRTTDNHCMSIVGMLCHKGEKYYIMKNSWGEDYAYHGFVFLSESYVRMKTIALFMTRDAYQGRANQ